MVTSDEEIPHHMKKVVDGKKTDAWISRKFMKKPIYYITVSILSVEYIAYLIYRYLPVFDPDFIIPFIFGISLFIPPIIFLFTLRFDKRGVSMKRLGFISKMLITLTVVSIAYTANMLFNEDLYLKTLFFYTSTPIVVLYLAWFYHSVNRTFCGGRLKLYNILAVHLSGAIFGIFAFYFEMAYTTLIEAILDKGSDISVSIIAVLMFVVLPTIFVLKFIWYVIEKEPEIREER